MQRVASASGDQRKVCGMGDRGTSQPRSLLNHTFAELETLPAEGTLVDLAFVSSREWQAVVLKLEDGRWRFLAHVVDRVLVTCNSKVLSRFG